MDPSGTSFWSVLGDICRFIAGIGMATLGVAVTVITSPLYLIPGAAVVPQFGLTMVAYGEFMAASAFSQEIKADMDRIKWNPFNSNEQAVLDSTNFSFYKGSTVIRHNIPKITSWSIFNIIFLNSSGSDSVDLRHEWGHSVQSWILGVTYIPTIAIPSVIGYFVTPYNKYYSQPWERTADWFGGVKRPEHTKYSLLWSILYLGGAAILPFKFF
jgi:hypothetical protein